MKNFFKVLSLAVVAAFVLASCEKEKQSSIQDVNLSKSIEYTTEQLKFDNWTPKKTAYTIENWPIVKFHLNPYNSRFNPYPGTEERYSVIVSSPTEGRQQWLLDNVATSKISNRHVRADDPNGEIYGNYYKWKGGADLSYADLDLILTSGVNGFHIPTSDDIFKLFRITGSREECASVLFLTDNQVYLSGNYTTMVGPAFWVNNTNISHPDAGSLFTFTVEGENRAHGVVGTRMNPGSTNLYANIRLVRDLD